MHPLVAQLKASLPANCRHVCVAFSGGLDSRVLLELALQLSALQPLTVRALHVHHQLSNNADSWVEFAEQTCQHNQIQLSVYRVNPEELLYASLEDRARRVRYNAFTQELQPNEVLLQGHHQDDQAETLLLRILRGAGTTGLASIPFSRPLGAGLIVRPLLNTPRSALQEFAQVQGISWIEDESNFSSDYDRNFLRLEVLPLLKQRFPAALTNLARVTQLASEGNQLHQDLAQLDLTQCQLSPVSLNLSALTQLAEYRQINLIRHWLIERQLTPPGQQIWAQLQQLYTARADAQPQVNWATTTGQRVEARRFKQELFIAPSTYFQPLPKNWQQIWNGTSSLNTPAGVIQLHLPSNLVPQEFVLKSRQGGEQIKLAQRGHRDVKRLLQELNLPPWQRQQLIFVWHHNQLIAVGQHLRAQGWE